MISSVDTIDWFLSGTLSSVIDARFVIGSQIKANATFGQDRTV
jgi:hypothetical protein